MDRIYHEVYSLPNNPEVATVSVFGPAEIDRGAVYLLEISGLRELFDGYVQLVHHEVSLLQVDEGSKAIRQAIKKFDDFCGTWIDPTAQPEESIAKENDIPF